MEYFIDNFYYNAIVEGETIADSLNYASIQYLGTDFPSSLLNGGYYTYYPPPMGWRSGQMRVLGASYLHLVAYYNTLSMSSNGYGSTDPTQDYMENSIATVQAYPDSGYDFDYWLYDGWLQLWQNPVQICMADPHTLTAYFTPSQETHSLTVDGYCLSPPFDVYPDVWVYDDDTDTTWYSTAPVTFYDLPNRDLQITVSVPQDPMQFSYMYYEGGPLYGNPDTITLSGDYHVTAYYYVPMYRVQPMPPDT